MPGNLLQVLGEALLFTPGTIASAPIRDHSEIEDRARAAAVASEDRFRTLFRLSPVPLVLCDLAGIFRRANPLATELLGWPPDALDAGASDSAAGQEWSQVRFYTSDGRRLPWPQNPIAEALRAAHGIRAAEVTIECAMGVQRPVLLSVAPLRGVAGQPDGAITALLDLTERRTADQRLQAAERIAASGQLAAALAHEINNPLEAVNNVLYLLERHSGLDLPTATLVNKGAAELDRVSRIVRQSLSYFRVAASPRPVRLGEMVLESLAVFSEKFGKRGIAVESSLADATVPGYPGELRQVLDNLLLNARRSHCSTTMARSRSGLALPPTLPGTSWRKRPSGIPRS